MSGLNELESTVADHPVGVEGVAFGTPLENAAVAVIRIFRTIAVIVPVTVHAHLVVRTIM